MCCAQPSNKMVLNVLIALYAAFLRWHLAGANWTVMFSSFLRKEMRSVDTSLSRMWKVGRSPSAFRFLMIVVTALIWLAFFLLFMGSANTWKTEKVQPNQGRHDNHPKAKGDRTATYVPHPRQWGIDRPNWIPWNWWKYHRPVGARRMPLQERGRKSN